MLKKEEKITDSIIENMMSWYHTGFNVFCGERIWPSNSEGLDRLAQYIIPGAHFPGADDLHPGG